MTPNDEIIAMDGEIRHGSLKNHFSGTKPSSLAHLYEIGPLRLRDRSLKTVQAYINRSNLRHNAALLKKHCGPAVNLCAVVKANGYGHDARSVVSALNGTHADSFAVSTIEEAEQIYPFVAGKTILITCPLFDGIDPQLIKLAQTRSFHCSACSINGLQYVQNHLADHLPPLNIHIKVDTGMGRLGTDIQQAHLLFQAVHQTDQLKLAGLYTHFATADDDLAYTNQQLTLFEDFLQAHAPHNQPPLVKHTCNTSAALRLPEAHYDMVRCGIGIYGYVNLAGKTDNDLDLLPALRVEAPVVQVKSLRPGQSCGYGLTFTASHDMTIGIVPVGYADGLLRDLSNRAVMIAGDHQAPILGRISMDLTIIDLSTHPDPREGMTVTVIDDKPHSPCNARALADLAETIPYEILTAIGNRIKRQLVD